MIGVGADGFVVEGSQALFFLLGQRATPRAAGELQAIPYVSRSRSRLRRKYGVILTPKRDHVFAHLGWQGRDPSLVHLRDARALQVKSIMTGQKPQIIVVILERRIKIIPGLI